MNDEYSVGNVLSKALSKFEKECIKNWLYSDNESYYHFLSKVFSEYLDLISNEYRKNFSLSESEYQYLHSIANSICQTVKYYLRGELFKSHEVFKRELSDFLNRSFQRSSHNSFSNYVDSNGTSLSRGLVFYRARIGSNKSNFRHKEMFHIPFEKRNKIENYRFSVNGLPCLYLSNKPLVCWLELNEPNLNNLYFSRFHFLKPIKLLDLSHYGSIKDFATLHWKFRDKNRFDSLIYWLVRFCCVLPKKKTMGPFHEEYIIPQMVLQLVKESSAIDGVIFTSSKEYIYNQESSANMLNIAIPAKSELTRNHCPQLSEIFEWTEPVMFSDLRINRKGNFKYGDFDEEFFWKYFYSTGSSDENSNTAMFYYKNRACYYYNSVFFEIEKRLLNLNAKRMLTEF